MPLAAGSRLGPYEILAPIGEGGMGEVYKARDTRLSRTVAIKTIKGQCSERFEREARAISALNHPNICTLHDVGAQDGAAYLVMEHVEGKPLKGPLPVDEALRYAVQIADALEAAHHRGVIHRDLKPSNILVTKSGIKLLDFGVAKFARPEALPDVTLTTPLTGQGTILGTLQYMAPEQLEGKEADARSDIFSFGLVLHEMLTGRRAFEASNQASLIAAILTSRPQRISAASPSVPPRLDWIVETCLAKDPDERWQSAHDLKLELKWLVDRAPEEPKSPVVSRASIREKLAWSATLLLLVVVAGVLVGHFRGVSPQPAQPLRSSLLPPANWSFVPSNFAVSPDGARLTFVAVSPEGKNMLWVRALSASNSQQITGTEGALQPFWSPDNRRIGFFTLEGKLKAADIAGGGVQIICDAPAGPGGAWSRDGEIVFAPNVAGPLFHVPAAGGVPVPATRLPRESSGQSHRWPAFLPDGKHFLYLSDWSGPADRQGNGIYAGSLDSTEARLISAELAGNVRFASGHLLYVRDRTLMAQPFDPERLRTTGAPVPITQQELERDVGFSQSGFSVSQNGVLVFQSAADDSTRLVWVDRSGKEVGQVPESTGYKDPNLSPDGRYLAVSSDDGHNGRHYVRVYDLARNVTTRLTDGGNDEFPEWSRDGKKITYVSADGQMFYINQVAADGSGPPQVLVKGPKMMPCDWSADGHLVFMNFERGRPSLEVYSAADRQVTRVTAQGAEAKFSPDGKWIVYSAAGSRALSEIMVQAFPGPGGHTQISSGGGFQPRWSPDGKQVFYIALDKKLMAAGFDPRTGSATAPRVLFQTRIVGTRFVFFQYDVASDGRFLVNSVPADYSSPLTLINGWTSQLRP